MITTALLLFLLTSEATATNTGNIRRPAEPTQSGTREEGADNPCSRYPPTCNQLCRPSIARPGGLASLGEDVLCSCLPGYRIDDGDRKRCAVASGSLPKLICVINGTIHVLKQTRSIESGYDFKAATAVKTGSTARFPVCDGRGDIFYISVDGGSIMMLPRGDETSSDVISYGLRSPTSLQLDWINHQLYFADTDHRAIFTCGIDSKKCVAVMAVTPGFKVNSMALDPINGRMFWLEEGKSPRLLGSNMDGSETRILLDTGLGLPRSLIHDYPSGRVCWVDRQEATVKCLPTEGAPIVRTVLVHRNSVPRDIAMFDDVLYWTSVGKKSIRQANKFTGTHREEAFRMPGVPHALIVYHEAMQHIPDDYGACGFLPCSHVCLPAGRTAYRCACPTGHTLLGNQHDCAEDPGSPFLVLVKKQQQDHHLLAEVQQTRPATIGAWDTRPLPLFSYRNISALAFHFRRKLVYFSDVTAVDGRVETTVYRASLGSYADRKPILPIPRDGQITSMAIDWIQDTLYLLDTYNKKISAYDLDEGSDARTVLQGLTDPRDVEVDPLRSFIIYSDAARGIFKCTVVGDSCSALVDDVDAAPSELALDVKAGKLYWADDKANIFVMAYDCSSCSGAPDKLHGTGSYKPTSMTLIDHQLYWTEDDPSADLAVFDLSANLKSRVSSIGSRDRQSSHVLGVSPWSQPPDLRDNDSVEKNTTSLPAPFTTPSHLLPPPHVTRPTSAAQPVAPDLPAIPSGATCGDQGTCPEDSICQQDSTSPGNKFLCYCPAGLSDARCVNETGGIVTFPLLGGAAHYAWVAGVLGFLVLFTVAVLGVVFCCRRRKRVQGEAIGIIRFHTGFYLPWGRKKKRTRATPQNFDNPNYEDLDQLQEKEKEPEPEYTNITIENSPSEESLDSAFVSRRDSTDFNVDMSDTKPLTRDDGTCNDAAEREDSS